MSLVERLNDDLKQALRAGDDVRKRTIRMLLSALKNEQIENRAPLGNQQELSVVQREAKRRREAAGEYSRLGRDDLAQQELAELDVLQSYLPAQLSEAEVRAVVERTVDSLNARSMGDMGRVMSAAMAELRGQADGKIVSQLVRETLAARQAEKS